MNSRPTLQVDRLLTAHLDALLSSVVDADQRQLQVPGGARSERETLKDKRLQELLDCCREEALQQVVGPFGLTPAMFSDKRGGNVTTQHNANQDIYAKTSEHYNRKTDYDYSAAKTKKKNDAVKAGTMNSQTFVHAHTHKKAQTKRTAKSNGKLVMNAELDHTIPLKQTHKEGGWMLTPEQRKKLASEEDNLHFTTFENNREKSDTAAETALSAQNGYDESITKPLIDKARAAIDQHQPDTKDRLLYHGKALGITGAKEFGKTGLRRAMGVLLFEVVNGSFVEVHKVVSQRNDQQPLLDRVVAAVERVLKRAQGKFKAAFEAFFEGGLQGLMGNLLTFLINNLITTSAKVVTIIREGMQELLKALKLLLWPPKEMSGTEVIAPLVQQELAKVDHSVRHQFRRAKRLLSRETSLLEERHHQRIETLLEHSQSLKVIYEKRLALQQIWIKTSTNGHDMLAAIKEWVHEAEASGIHSLREFAKQLKTYSLRPAAV